MHGTAGTANHRSTAWLAVRVVVLATLWVAVNLWFTTHVGKSLTEIGLVNAVLAAAAAILALLPESQQDAVGQGKTRLLQRLVQRLLAPGLLACLAVAFVAVGSFVSSVRVERSGVPGARAIELRAADAPIRSADLDAEQTTLRMLAWTLPFAGRDLSVRVSGFAARDAALRPWRPLVVALDELAPEPGVLLRVALEDLSFLAGGRLHLACLAPGGAVTSVATAAGRGLYRLGAATDPDERQVATWIADALAKLSAAAGLDEATRTKIADAARAAWSRADPGPELPCFEPGRTIRALLCTSRQQPWAAVEIRVEPRLQALALARLAAADREPSLCRTVERGDEP